MRRVILEKMTSARPKRDGAAKMIRLYQMYDSHRNALLWFLQGLNAGSYDDYRRNYSGASIERMYFTSVCGFFELSGVLVKRGLIDRDLFFDLFNPMPYWKRAKKVVLGMRKERPHIYENFELLAKMREEWNRTRPSH